MTLDLDDIQEVCSYESIGITQNGYVKIYELKSVNYAGVAPYECIILDDEFILSLLKRYKKMYLYDSSKEWFHKMPEYITHLILEFGSFKDINLNKLHNGLTNLVINNIYPNYDEKGFNQSLDNLPHTLETLVIISQDYNQPINSLPTSLTYLTISSDCFDQPLSNLPPNLYSLSISRIGYYMQYKYLSDNLLNLPEGLNTLNISNKILPTNASIKDGDESENEFQKYMEARYPNLDISVRH